MVRPTPWANVKNGTSSFWNVQYHVANEAANTILLNDDINDIAQKKPKTLIT